MYLCADIQIDWLIGRERESERERERQGDRERETDRKIKVQILRIFFSYLCCTFLFREMTRDEKAKEFYYPLFHPQPRTLLK